jgi:hypothetical protein
MSLRVHFDGRVASVEKKSGETNCRPWEMTIVKCVTSNSAGREEYFSLCLFSPTHDHYIPIMKVGIPISGTAEVSAKGYLIKATGKVSASVNFTDIKFITPERPASIPFERKVEQVGGEDVPF